MDHLDFHNVSQTGQLSEDGQCSGSVTPSSIQTMVWKTYFLVGDSVIDASNHVGFS